MSPPRPVKKAIAPTPKPRRTPGARIRPAGTTAVGPRAPDAYEVEAARLIKTEMQRRGVAYKRLAELLNEDGSGYEDVSEKQLVTRMNRGTFPLSFALRCLRVMKVTTLRIEPVEGPAE